MTTRFTVLQAIDDLFHDLEDKGFTEYEIVSAMAEYLEIVDELSPD
jgi:hypothetical protein